MDIQEILEMRGFNTKSRTKLVRHYSPDLDEIYKDGLLEIYQSFQLKPIFNCEYIISFLAMEGKQARFAGVYKVLGEKPGNEAPQEIIEKYPELCAVDGYYYLLEKVQRFTDLEGRIVIDWGDGTLAWHQWFTAKKIVEILPENYVNGFPGYLDFVLRYDDLVKVVQYPDAHREWHRMLSAVAGIYLIVDQKTGNQYIGSAYGKDGVLGRWRTYVQNPDGGNKYLNKLLKDDLSYAKNFRFSLLHTLPKTLTMTEIIAWEGIYKEKLGSRAFGLNGN